MGLSYNFAFIFLYGVFGCVLVVRPVDLFFFVVALKLVASYFLSVFLDKLTTTLGWRLFLAYS